MTDYKKGAKYWTNQFNPVIGCSPVSEGCLNCWAKGFAERLKMTDDFSCRKLTGAKAPKSGIVFVGNMSDIFKEWNTDTEIIDWLNELYPLAVNLILTKRANRFSEMSKRLPGFSGCPTFYGVTTEDQEQYNKRIKAVRNADSALYKWISAEPLLGPIDMQLQYIAPEDRLFGWVIVGAESGQNRRPCKIEWVESIVEQCKSAGIPVFVKQLDLGGKLVKDISKFPSNLQLRQVPWGERNV